MVLIVWWITCFIWSTVWLAIKIGVSDVPPFGFAALRLALAVSVVLAIAWRRRQNIPLSGADVRLIAQTGLLLLGVNYALTYWGAQHISSGLTATLQATTPLFAVVVGRSQTPEERPTRAELLALMMGVAGVGVIFWPDLELSRPNAMWGAIAVIGGAFCVSCAYVRVRRDASHLDTATLMAGQMIAGGLFLLGLSLAIEGNPLAFDWHAPAIGALIYLAIAGSLLAFWLNYWLLARMDARAVLMMAVVEPLIAVALGAAVLGERITATALGGGVLILVAVYLTLQAAHERS